MSVNIDIGRGDIDPAVALTDDMNILKHSIHTIKQRHNFRGDGETDPHFFG